MDKVIAKSKAAWKEGVLVTDASITILDACCGSKMMWFDKHHPNTLYCDINPREQILCDGRKLEVKPDFAIDFTNMPFQEGAFHHVVFDPPILRT